MCPGDSRLPGITSRLAPLLDQEPQASSTPTMLPKQLLHPDPGAPTSSLGLAPRLPNHPRAPPSVSFWAHTTGRASGWGLKRDGHLLS